MSKLMNKQEVFEFIVEHLLKQNEKSISRTATTCICRYRGPNGLRCAVGALIDDGDYRSSMEGLPISEGGRVYDVVAKKVNMQELDMFRMLRGLQAVHDDHVPSEWPHALRHIADTFHLTLPLSLKEA